MSSLSPLHVTDDYSVYGLQVFKDNYIWLVETEKHAVVIDPGDAQRVKQALSELNKPLSAILITHAHADHVAGIPDLLGLCPVFGPRGMPAEVAAWCTDFVDDQQTLEALNPILGSVTAISTPGHSTVHICFHLEQPAWVFTGDCLFLGGCGRVFTGNYENAFFSLQKLANLPDKTLIFASHELTDANLKFLEHWYQTQGASQTENKKAYHFAAQYYREKLKETGCTYPGVLGDEKAYNPFLNAKSIIDFANVRDAKNVF